MTRNLKTLGLAAVAALALSALGASAAQATTYHHLTVPTAPSIVTADDESGVAFSTENGEFKCKSLKYEGTTSENTNTEITVRPTFNECTNEITGQSATITMNHCAVILTGETDANGDAMGHLECTEGNDVEISSKVLFTQCTLHVKPQTAIGVHLTQTENPGTGKQAITAQMTVSHILYSISPAGFPCSDLGNGEDATMTGAVTSQAYTEKESCTALSGTEKTTPSGGYFNNCENAVQDLELTTT